MTFSQKKHGFAHVFNGFWLLTLTLVGVMFFALEKTEVSIAEKRRLAPSPSFSVATFLSGAFSKQADAFVSDNFPLRTHFISIAKLVEQNRGLPKQNLEVYATTPTVAPKTNESESQAKTLPNSPPAPEADFQNIRSVIVTEGRAVQIFQATDGMVAPFAKMVNASTDELDPRIKVYAMAIPVGSDFYLPRSVNKGIMWEKRNIDYYYSQLSSRVAKIDVYGALEAQKSGYIQFNTDHHWTATGAYYAYRAFGASAGFEPLPLTSFEKAEIPGLLGTLYSRTQSKALRDKGDVVTYYRPPVEVAVTTYKNGLNKSIPGTLVYTPASGAQAYGVFLGGDFPLMRVVTSVKNGRKIIVTKDSYGNAFVPFLASHFEEIYIVDFRYFRGQLQQIVDRFGANELLFAHNVYVLNNPSAVNLLNAMRSRRVQTPLNKDLKQEAEQQAE